MPVKAVINLKNIIYNAKAIRRQLPNNVKFCAVVKADAYGHGAEMVSNAIYKLVDCFAVATADEGIKLRLAGIDKDILVLTKTFDDELPLAVNYNLTLTVSDLNDLIRYERECKRQNVKLKTHVKFDTGMHRQGISEISELTKTLNYYKNHKMIELCGLYSHFAKPESERSRKRALHKFTLAKKFVKDYNNVVCHISASGGFIKGDYLDMVRIGILLYGYKPFPTDKIKVRPALKVYAPIVKTRKLKSGDCALYGEKRTAKDTKFALIRYGYADGLFRKEIKGQFNNRCMDITAVNGNFAHKKQFCVIDDAEKLARQYGTISYEILVKSALRAEKKYLF